MKTTTMNVDDLMSVIVELIDVSVPAALDKICEGEGEQNEQNTKKRKSANVAYYAGDFEGRNKAKENRSKRRKTSILMDMKERRDGPTNKGYHAHRIRYSNSKSNFECATNGMAMHSDRRRMSAAVYKLKEYDYEVEDTVDDTISEKKVMIDHADDSFKEHMTDKITQVFVDALIKDGVSPDVAYGMSMSIWLACDDYNLAEVAYGNVK